MDTDRRIALIVAGTLLVGFAGIATISLWGGGAPDELARFTPAARIDPTPQPVQLASLLDAAPLEPASAGTPDEAEAFQVEPGANYLARGIEEYQARNFGHAAAYLGADVEARPERAYSHYLLGLALWKSGSLDEAAEALRRSAELDASAVKTFVNLSRIENDRGAYDAALEAAERALDLAPEDPAALFLEGRSLRNLGESDQAVESLRRSVEIDPGNGYAWNLLGLTLLNEAVDDAALEALQHAAALQPAVAYIQNNLGMALEQNGRRAEAVAAYRRAVDLDVNHARATDNLARLEPLVPHVEPGVQVARDEPGDELATEDSGGS